MRHYIDPGAWAGFIIAAGVTVTVIGVAALVVFVR